jgi:uncharacterized RDD family membrane protein YckC
LEVDLGPAALALFRAAGHSLIVTPDHSQPVITVTPMAKALRLVNIKHAPIFYPSAILGPLLMKIPFFLLPGWQQFSAAMQVRTTAAEKSNSKRSILP